MYLMQKKIFIISFCSLADFSSLYVWDIQRERGSIGFFRNSQIINEQSTAGQVVKSSRNVNEARFPPPRHYVLGELFVGYQFIGLVGLRDPPKPGVKESIEECNTAGIQVVMVTGDHPLTAEAIARQVCAGSAGLKKRGGLCVCST